MPRMLLLVIVLAVASLAGIVQAGKASVTGWMGEQVFKQYFDAQADSLYPVLIEARPALGNGVEYRVLFIPKPASDFVYRSIYGASDASFEEALARHRKQGFVLIQHQQESLQMGTIHQAVWVMGRKG